MSKLPEDKRKLADTPQDELRRYMEELLQQDLPWYESQATSHYRYWFGLQFTAMICTALSGLIAALMDARFFGPYGRPTIVFLSFAGTLSITWLMTFRHREMEDLRERGHLHLRRALNEARAALTVAKEPTDYLAIHQKLRDCVDKLDREQHAEAHTILGTGSIQNARQRNTSEQSQPANE